MSKDRLTEAMGYIDPAYIEEVDVQTAAKPGRRWKRPALIAACLCLVLAGTALAAELAGVHVSDFFEGRGTDVEGIEFDFLGYDIHASGIKCIPVDSLAPEVFEYIEEARVSDGFYWINKAVYSKERADEFLGLELYKNPVLEQVYAGTIGFNEGDNWGLDESSYLGPNHVGAPGMISLSGWGDLGPQFIEVCLAYQFYPTARTIEIENGWRTWTEYMPVYVRAEIYTDVKNETLEEEGFNTSLRMRQNGYADLTALGKFSYTTPGGLEATIMATSSSCEGYDGEEEITYMYAAYFVLDGIFYEVEGSYNDESRALETIEQILDGFVYEAPAQP